MDPFTVIVTAGGFALVFFLVGREVIEQEGYLRPAVFLPVMLLPLIPFVFVGLIVLIRSW